MAASFVKFIPNPQPSRLIQTRARRAIEQIWGALERWAQTWSPGSAGATGGNYFVVPIRNGDQFTVILASHMQYGTWRGFGAISVGGGDMLSPPSDGAAPTIKRPGQATDAKQPGSATPADDLIPGIRDEIRRIVTQEFGRAWQ
jgi:hypothetical protein